jgi:hypothetical protein
VFWVLLGLAAGEGGGGAEQAGLRVDDDLDRHVAHEPLEPAFCEEPIAES